MPWEVHIVKADADQRGKGPAPPPAAWCRQHPAVLPGGVVARPGRGVLLGGYFTLTAVQAFWTVLYAELVLP